MRLLSKLLSLDRRRHIHYIGQKRWGGRRGSGSHRQQSPKDRKVDIRLNTLSEKICFSMLNIFPVVEKRKQEIQ